MANKKAAPCVASWIGDFFSVQIFKIQV